MEENKKMSLAQRMGIKRTVVRPSEETDIQLREDRIGRYFRKYLDRFVFVEFSDEFLERSKVKDIMKGIPIPLRKQDIKKFSGGSGLEPALIGENMAWVMGSDPKFKYTKNYVAYLKKLFNTKIDEGMLKEGRDAAEKEDWDNACIHFRAALCMNPIYMHAMYSYARVCRSMYLDSEDPEYVGRFKAEALDWFELLTEIHPRFAQGYYYLGYAYLNIGLYAKTEFAWRRFLQFTHNGKDRREINTRLKQIKDPVQIEAACNDISAGRMQQGLEKLPRDSRFLYVCNHRSLFDPMMAMAYLADWDIAFISKPSNFRIPLGAPIVQAAGYLAIDRENDRNALKTILTAADYLKRDLCCIGIYPEGTRSKTGALLPFHAGSFKIAQRAKVPVVVACMRGSEKAQTVNPFSSNRICLEILDVIPAEDIAAHRTDALAERVRDMIQACLDQAGKEAD